MNRISKYRKEFLIGFITLAYGMFITEETPDRVVFLDVGTGDSALIQIDGMNIIVDGGPDSSLLFKIEKYFKGVAPKIDLIVISHFHADHYIGLIDVVRRYDVSEIWVPDMCGKDDDAILKLSKWSNRVIPIGATPRLFFSGPGTLEGYVPGMPNLGCIPASGGEGKNNGSIVIHFDTPEVDFYFMGDLEKEGEAKMLEKYSVTNIDILKAGHHCSNTSSTKHILSSMRPNLAICSTGEGNRYGHPDEEVIERFTKMGIDYKVTYLDGDIVIPL